MYNIELSKNQVQWIDAVLLPALQQKKIKYTNVRTNSGAGKTQCFGYGCRRGRTDDFFKANVQNVELYSLLLLLGSEIVPSHIKFTCIQVNHNYESKPHMDKKNVGESLTFSLGNFTGGELVVDGIPNQTKLLPLVFDASTHEHYNLPIQGNRYSITFFVNKLSTSNPFSTDDIHKNMMESIYI